MLKRNVVIAVLAVLVSLSASRARGDEAPALARQHFEAGRALYKLGNYRDAVREFSAGYALVPRPGFLLNLGQAHRKLNEYEKAREYFRRYLHESPTDDPERSQAAQVIETLDKLIAEHPVPPPSPEPPPPRPVVSAPVPQEIVAAPPPVKPHKSFARRHWWIFPVSAVVLAGAAVGIYFAVKPASQVSCTGATLGCIDTQP